MKGIDVSSYQGHIEWNKVKASGYQFAILRLGIGDNIISQDDQKLKYNIQKCKEQNLPYAVYLVSYAKNLEGSESVESEIEHTKRLIQDANPFCIFYDMEIENTAYLGKEILTNHALKFCQYFKELGYEVGVYANKNWFTNHLDYKLLKSRYRIWLANYEVESPSLECDLWQYTDKGRVDGIDQNTVDLNLMYQNFISNQEVKKSFDEIAQEVIDGLWGNGEERKNKLESAGYSYEEIQKKVNAQLSKTKIVQYIVKKGDTLSKIATMYKVPYQELANYNKIVDINKIYIGQIIKIPNSKPNSNFEYYRVKKNDNLSKIAKRYNTTVKNLIDLNAISDPNLIYINQRLRVK